VSYNIDSVDTPELDAWMRAADVVSLFEEHHDSLPEGCFLEDIIGTAEDATTSNEPDAKIELPHLWWYGEGSGHSFDLLKDTIGKKIMGRVDAIFTWEGGDSVSGLRIKDGVVTECDVKMTLVPKGKKSK
jgi:hypothetical protein